MKVLLFLALQTLFQYRRPTSSNIDRRMHYIRVNTLLDGVGWCWFKFEWIETFPTQNHSTILNDFGWKVQWTIESMLPFLYNAGRRHRRC